VVDQRGVEVEPRAHEAVVRHGVELRPRQIQNQPGASDPEAVDARPLGPLGLDPEVFETLHCARRQAVAADLLARELRLVDQEHAAPRARQPVRRRGAAGPAADDDRVERRRLERRVLHLRRAFGLWGRFLSGLRQGSFSACERLHKESTSRRSASTSGMGRG
jgi:hypothetical protein